MPKQSGAAMTMPPQAASALRILGEHLAIARIRRKQSQRSWCKRLNVSVPTLIRMEHGDPAVSMGVYATAIWLVGRAPALSELAAPNHDLGAIELDVKKALKRRAVRSRPSIAARLGGRPARPED